MHDSEKFTLPAKEVARITGASISTVRTAMRLGTLPTWRPNSRVVLTSRAHALAWWSSQLSQLAQLRVESPSAVVAHVAPQHPRP